MKKDGKIVITIILTLFVIGMAFSIAGASTSQEKQYTADELGTHLTENQYIAAVNNWTYLLDKDGPVVEGEVVLRQTNFGTDIMDVQNAMIDTVPPAKYAKYDAVFEQAVHDRAKGFIEMKQGKGQGDHALFTHGKNLVIKSASEFKSISNQTEEMTTWN